MKVSKTELSKLALRADEIFFFLVEHANKYGFDVDAILEIPDNMGNTCFHIASECSKRICYYIIQRIIRINSINLDMMVPDFKYPELTIQMMTKGVNPLVISNDGRSQIDYNPHSFESDEAKRLLSQFPRSIYFSIEDIYCSETCPVDCPSNLKRFYYKNGVIVEMTDENRIGVGGFGMVFKQLFHGKVMAMKAVWTGDLSHSENQINSVEMAVDDFERNIAEIRFQMASAGPGILHPVAFVRQQGQEQDENRKWIQNNYNIFIYPLYDFNLYELHENYHSHFNDEILYDILNQCLIRECSNRKKQ